MRTNERVKAAIAILAGLVIGLGAYGEVIPQAVSFDGDGDYIAADNESNFDFGTGSFTITCRVKLAPGLADNDYTIIGKNLAGKYTTGTGGYPGYRLSQFWGDLRFNIWDINYQTVYEVTAGDVLKDNKWHTVVAMRDGQELKLYVDGVLEDSSGNVVPTDCDISTSNSSPFSIGAAVYWSQSRFFTGTVDEVAVYNRALTTTEVAEISNTGVNKTTSGIVAYYPFDDGTSNDATSNNNDATKYGDTKYVPGAVVSTKGMAFDGDGDYISCANESNFDFGTGNFSLSCWVKLNSGVASNDYTIIGKNLAGKFTSGSGGYPGYRLSQYYGSLRFNVWDLDNQITYAVSYSGALSDNNWHYVTAMRDGQELRLYVDGVLKSSSGEVVPTDCNFDNSSPFAIGAAVYWGQSRFFPGSIDEVAVYNKVLSSREIKMLMNFSPNYLSDGLVAYYSFDAGNATDDSVNNNDGTLYGDASSAGGIAWQGYEEINNIFDKIAFSISSLPTSGTLTLATANSISTDDLANVDQNDQALSVGAHDPYSSSDSDGLTYGTGPYVAGNIGPFRFNYFNNEFLYGGQHTAEMKEYASMHGFNIISGAAASWSHLPTGTKFLGVGGLGLNDWMDDEGYVSGRFDTLPSRSSIASVMYGDNLFPFTTGGYNYMIDMENPAKPLDLSVLRQQAWYPTSNQAQFEEDYYNGFIDAQLAAVDTAHTQGWTDVGIYGWQPWARTWYLTTVNETTMLENWNLYGKYIAAEVNLLYPSVYCFYWNTKNVAYAIHNIDKNVEYANKLSASNLKPTRPYFWNLLHGGGGGWRWWRELPLRNEDFRAMSMMNFFCGTDGLVLWSWSGFSDGYNPSIAPVPEAGDTLSIRAEFTADQEGGGSATFYRYDAIYILEVTASDVVRFQLIDSSSQNYGVDADPANSIYDDEDYSFPVYTISKSSLSEYLRTEAEPVSAMIEGMAAAKLFEYILYHGITCIDESALTQWSNTSPIVRRVKFGPYHIIATYDPLWENYTSRTVTIEDFDGIQGVDVQVTADNKTRIYVIKE